MSDGRWVYLRHDPEVARTWSIVRNDLVPYREPEAVFPGVGDRVVMLEPTGGGGWTVTSVYRVLAVTEHGDGTEFDLELRYATGEHGAPRVLAPPPELAPDGVFKPLPAEARDRLLAYELEDD